MNKEVQQYHDALQDAFSKIMQQPEAFEAAADVMAKVIAEGDVVHIIGPGGHSSMAAEEVLWRAGGLAAMNAILDAGINLVHGAKRTNIIERTPGYAARVLDAYRIGRKPGEVIIIANAYGINTMSIDTVLEAKKRKMVTIGITSTEFAEQVPADHPARHPSGKNLYQEVDYFINCHLPYGDAVVDIEGSPMKTAPTSSLCNAFTVNILMIETMKALVKRGVTPPVWMSANLPGGDEANRENEEKYIPLVRHLA